MGFIDVIKAKAKQNLKTIVLPETEDIRTYEAAANVLKEGTAKIVLVGSKEEIEKNGAGFDISGAIIVDPATCDKTESYIAKLVELRGSKGMTEEKARELLLTPWHLFWAPCPRPLQTSPAQTLWSSMIKVALLSSL